MKKAEYIEMISEILSEIRSVESSLVERDAPSKLRKKIEELSKELDKLKKEKPKEPKEPE